MSGQPSSADNSDLKQRVEEANNANINKLEKQTLENGHSGSTASLCSDSMDSLLEEDCVDDVIICAPTASITSPLHKTRICGGGRIA